MVARIRTPDELAAQANEHYARIRGDLEPREVGETRRYYQHIVRFSASFAFAVDVAMLTLGGYLKKKENLSARLGDVLSSMYLASMVLKHHENQGRPIEDLPIVEWACRDLLYTAQEQLHGFLRNFPNAFLAGVMRALIFPRGLTYFAPGDRTYSKDLHLWVTAAEAAWAPKVAALRPGDLPDPAWPGWVQRAATWRH